MRLVVCAELQKLEADKLDLVQRCHGSQTHRTFVYFVNYQARVSK